MNKTKIVLRKIFTQRNPHTTMKHTTYLKLGQKTLYYSLLDSHLRPRKRSFKFQAIHVNMNTSFTKRQTKKSLENVTKLKYIMSKLRQKALHMRNG